MAWQAFAAFVAQDEAALVTIAQERGVENPEAIVAVFKATIDKWDALLADVDRTDVEALAALARSEIYDRADASAYGL